jgi:2-dehydro-3-deoxygalactonokinase
VGALAAAPGEERRCFVLPGTHSKWAWTSGTCIERFATYMTGEVFEVLTRHSILGRLMQGDAHDPAAFARGLERARASGGAPPGRLLHDLFGTRTLGLFGELPATALGSYLSGLLIGAEVTAALAETGGAPVTILASSQLASLYATALAAAGAVAAVGDVDSAARGLHAVARTARLLVERKDA